MENKREKWKAWNWMQKKNVKTFFLLIFSTSSIPKYIISWLFHYSRGSSSNWWTATQRSQNWSVGWSSRLAKHAGLMWPRSTREIWARIQRIAGETRFCWCRVYNYRQWLHGRNFVQETLRRQHGKTQRNLRFFIRKLR